MLVLQAGVLMQMLCVERWEPAMLRIASTGSTAVSTVWWGLATAGAVPAWLWRSVDKEADAARQYQPCLSRQGPRDCVFSQPCSQPGHCPFLGKAPAAEGLDATLILY